MSRIQAFIEEHLTDPDLSPESIALAHHISVRYLHKLFQQEGTTVGQWIRRRRLDACRRELSRSANRRPSVAAVAQRWGSAARRTSAAPSGTPTACPQRMAEFDEVMRFEVLGPLRVRRAERELDLGFPQQRALLGLLMVRAGRPVQVSEIVDVLWASRPPASAPNVVRRYVGALRRLLEPGLPPRASGRRLPRRTGAYLLDAEPDEIDLLRFRELTLRGKRAVATGRPEVAVRQFVGALGEWRGPVAMGLPASAREHALFHAVEHELVLTTRMAADAALLCGTAGLVLPSLRRAIDLEPWTSPCTPGS